MRIDKTTNGSVLELKIFGEVNSATSPQFAEALEDLSGIDQVIIDIEEMEYITSAGLRVLLATNNALRGKGGKAVIINAQESAMKIFRLTGLTDIFGICTAEE